MGASNASMGLSNGIVLFALPQLMAAEHVPEARIAFMTAIAFSSTFRCVFFAPILDVHFSRRWYATVLAISSAICTAFAILGLHHLLLLTVASVLATLTSVLSSAALGG